MSSNALTLPEGFGAVPAAFKGAVMTNDELGAGVASSYAVIGIRGKVWSVKFGGEETQLMREDGDGPRHSIEVVLLKASPNISKIYYKGGYEPGANSPPDCWSGDGIKPDPSVKEKVCASCAQCPMNAWGSRTTEAGKQAKACSDSRRVAIAPLNDIDNDAQGGPMLLRVPAASLKGLKAYGDLLTGFNYPYFAAATRVSFDTEEAFPMLVFSAIRPLNEAEAAKVIAMREDRRVATVLSENAATVAAGVAGTTTEAAAEVPKSPFEHGATAEAAPVTAKVTEPVKPKATKPKAAAATAPVLTPEEIAAAQKAAKIAAAKAALEALENEDKPKVVEKTPEELAAEAKAKKVAEAKAALAALEAEEAPAHNTVASLLATAGEEETAEEEASEAAEEGAPASFDAMLEGILGS